MGFKGTFFILTLSLVLNLIQPAPISEKDDEHLDPCLRSPCKHGEICLSSNDKLHFQCINEQVIKNSVFKARGVINMPAPVKQQAPPQPVKLTEEEQLKLINYPQDYYKEYLEYDPCLSSPCLFGKVCKSLAVEPRFICLNELEMTKEVSDARQIYRALELIYQDKVMKHIDTYPHNLNTNQNTNKLESVNTLKVKIGKARSKQDPCANNPCNDNLLCELDEDYPDGYVCLDVNNPNDIKLENFKNRNLLKDEEFVKNMTQECVKRGLIDRIPSPRNPKQFIVCLEDAQFTIMECPDNFVFNQYLDRCDYSSEPMSSGCESNPCLFGAKCVDLENFEYKCECPEGYSGLNCEKAPDVCAFNPCGEQGKCHSMSLDSPVPYYCTCYNYQTFGVNCDDTSEVNPCLNDEAETDVFPTQLDESIYVQCNKQKMHLKVCQKPLIFSPEDEICLFVDPKLRRRVEKIVSTEK